jgi:Flp pilus assembly protein TadG
MNHRNQRRGSNAIEFALTMPVFFGLVLGVIDFGYYFAAQAILDAAVLEGTRAGAVTDPASGADLEAIAENRAREIASLICGNDCDYDCVDRDVLQNIPGVAEADVVRELDCTVEWDITPLVGFVPTPDKVDANCRQVLEWQRSRGGP